MCEYMQIEAGNINALIHNTMLFHFVINTALAIMGRKLKKKKKRKKNVNGQ